MSLKPLLLVTASVALVACGVEDDRPASLSYIQQTILKQSCATATCHVSANAGPRYPAFDTDHATLHETLEGLACNVVTGECSAYGYAQTEGTPPRVIWPDASALINSLEGWNGALKMPPDEPIPDADIALIAAWIDAGAEDN